MGISWHTVVSSIANIPAIRQKREGERESSVFAGVGICKTSEVLVQLYYGHRYQHQCWVSHVAKLVMGFGPHPSNQ